MLPYPGLILHAPEREMLFAFDQLIQEIERIVQTLLCTSGDLYLQMDSYTRLRSSS